jgi:hypothetical protein
VSEAVFFAAAYRAAAARSAETNMDSPSLPADKRIDRDQFAFLTAGDILLRGLAPAQRAALFEAIPRIPGLGTAGNSPSRLLYVS